MSLGRISRIKNIIRNLIEETRGVSFGLDIKIDNIDTSERKISVKGRYISLWEEGRFSIILDRGFNVIKFEVKPKE